MNLNHVQKIVLGIFTFLPFLLFPIFLWQLFHTIGSTLFLDSHEADPGEFVLPVLSFIFPIILSAIGALALTIFYIVHVVLNKNLEPSEQILWILLFIFFGILAFPAYWIIRIWNNPKNP
jgi:hypothetical protein